MALTVHKRKQWATCFQIHRSLNAVFLRQQFNGKWKFSHLLSLISCPTLFSCYKIIIYYSMKIFLYTSVLKSNMAPGLTLKIFDHEIHKKNIDFHCNDFKFCRHKAFCSKTLEYNTHKLYGQHNFVVLLCLFLSLTDMVAVAIKELYEDSSDSSSYPWNKITIYRSGTT